MSWLLAKVYDRCMRLSEEACVRDWRRGLLADLDGEVLEIGAGTGLNLAHYPATVERLVLTEPDRYMRAQLERRRGSAPPRSVEIVDAPADALPFADSSFDAVVSTLVLCSVPDQGRALAEIRRVLRDDGRFVFLEHVVAPDKPRRHRWQRRVEPVWKLVFGGCHLTRDTVDAIERAGFEVTHQRESIRKANPLVRTSERGTARAVSRR